MAKMAVPVLSCADVSRWRVRYDFTLARKNSQAQISLLWVQEYRGYVRVCSLKCTNSTNSRVLAVKMLEQLLRHVDTMLATWCVIEMPHGARVWRQSDGNDTSSCI